MAKTSVKEVLFQHFSKNNNPAFFFDVDGTLKDTGKQRAPDRFNSLLPSILLNLQNIGVVGIDTDQSASEFSSFNDRLNSKLEVDGTALTGPYYFEGGHVKVPLNGSLVDDLEVVAFPEALLEIETLYGLVAAIIGIEDQWISLSELPTEILLPSRSTQGISSKSIFEKGPSISDITYHGEYDQVRAWLTEVAEHAGLLNYCDIVEAGNGTLRIVQKNVNKGTILLRENSAIPVQSIIYFGDQINELPVVEIIKAYGGTVILPANAHPDLYPFADYIATKDHSDGIVEVFTNI